MIDWKNIAVQFQLAAQQRFLFVDEEVVADLLDKMAAGELLTKEQALSAMNFGRGQGFAEGRESVLNRTTEQCAEHEHQLEDEVVQLREQLEKTRSRLQDCQRQLANAKADGFRG